MLSPTAGLDEPIETPWTRLETGTWLHKRPEKDVYILLIDVYRLRIHDAYKLRPSTPPPSFEGFEAFLKRLATQATDLMPDWWSDEKEAACLALAAESEGWSYLLRILNPDDCATHYAEFSFPFQLRMFAEAVVGPIEPGKSLAVLQKWLAFREQGFVDENDPVHLPRGFRVPAGRMGPYHWGVTPAELL